MIYKSLIKNKTVAVIGGGQTIDPKALKAKLIVRCNHHFTYQEGRTDILYHRLLRDITVELAEKPQIKHLRLSASGTFNTKKTTDWLLENGYSFSFWRWSKLAPFNPMTGVFAVMDIAKCRPKSLFITGMNFYTDGVGASSVMHQRKPNIQAIIDCSKMCTVITDSVLTEFLKENAKQKTRQSSRTR